jgi:iron(III) transport system substrate-binding protein
MNMSRTRLQVIGLAVSVLLGAATVCRAAPPVTVYCSAVAEWCDGMREAFEAATGTKVLMTVKSAGETLAQMRAEKDNPRGDVWWAGGGDQHLLAAELGLTEVYKSPTLPNLHSWATKQAEIAGWRSVGIYAGTLGIVWNTEALAKRKLPEPKCWADLIKPEYVGELQMSNAASSGTSYAVLATLVQIMGEEPAFTYLKKLHVNINQYPRSGAAPMRNVSTGESTLAITWMFAAVGDAQAGYPVKTIAPCEGTGYEIGSMSIIKGSRNIEGAKAWYEFALTPAAQATGTKARSYQIPSHRDAPLPPNTPQLGDVKLIDYDFARWGSSAARTALVSRWEKDIASAPR